MVISLAAPSLFPLWKPTSDTKESYPKKSSMLGPWSRLNPGLSSVVCIPTDISDSFLTGFHLIYLEEKYRTHEYFELFSEQLHLLAGDPFTFLPHGMPSGPLPCPFLGGNQEGNSCAFQHSDFDANKGRAKDLLTFHVCLFIFWNHLGVCLATFLFSGACGLVGSGLGQKENRKILRESTGCDRKLSGESGVGWSPLCQKCKSSRRLWAGNGIAESVERTLLHESGPTNRHTLGHRHK